MRSARGRSAVEGVVEPLDLVFVIWTEAANGDVAHVSKRTRRIARA